MKKYSIIRKNFKLTMLFGILMGLVFPIYASLFFSFDNKIKVLIFTIGCIIAGVLVGLIAFVITKNTVLKVIKQIVSELHNYNNGELDLTNLITIESDDDIGRLATEFNKFITTINELIFKTQTNSKDSILLTDLLSENIKKTNDSVKSIGHTINNVDSTTKEQYEKFIETKKGLNRLSDTVLSSTNHVLELFSQMDELTQNLLHQSDTVDSLSYIITDLVKIIGSKEELNSENLLSSSHNLVQTTNKTLDFNHGEFTSFRDSMVKIEDISNRTSILSINASIEAARSGQEGKGFNVIAQEVRKLSSNSQEVSSVINENLKNSFKQIVDSKENINTFQEGYIRLVDDVKQKIDRLNNDSNIIKKHTTKVKDSYSDITDTLKIIRESLQGLKEETSSSELLLKSLEKSTDSINLEMVQVKTESLGITKLSDETHSKIIDISSSVKDVSSLLDKFTANR